MSVLSSTSTKHADPSWFVAFAGCMQPAATSTSRSALLCDPDWKAHAERHSQPELQITSSRAALESPLAHPEQLVAEDR